MTPSETTTTIGTTAHLSDADIEAMGAQLDTIRAEVMDDLGGDDARYIRRVIAVQRGLDAGGRGLLQFSLLPPAWLAGTAALSVSKILENMEIGHNVLHGQWDWMNDPEIHSTNWEWDSASSAEGWKYSHNYVHHTYTNVLGKDRDLGYAAFRIDPEQDWKPWHLLQPLYNIGLAAGFEYGIAIYDIELEEVAAGRKPWAQAKTELGGLWRKIRGQNPQGLRRLPAALRPRRADHPAGQPHRERHPQRLEPCGDLLRALPGRRGDVHRGPARR